MKFKNISIVISVLAIALTANSYPISNTELENIQNIKRFHDPYFFSNSEEPKDLEEEILPEEMPIPVKKRSLFSNSEEPKDLEEEDLPEEMPIPVKKRSLFSNSEEPKDLEEEDLPEEMPIPVKRRLHNHFFSNLNSPKELHKENLEMKDTPPHKIFNHRLFQKNMHRRINGENYIFQRRKFRQIHKQD